MKSKLIIHLDFWFFTNQILVIKQNARHDSEQIYLLLVAIKLV